MAVREISPEIDSFFLSLFVTVSRGVFPGLGQLELVLGFTANTYPFLDREAKGVVFQRSASKSSKQPGQETARAAAMLPKAFYRLSNSSMAGWIASASILYPSLDRCRASGMMSLGKLPSLSRNTLPMSR